MILLEGMEMLEAQQEVWQNDDETPSRAMEDEALCEAQAKKILIELQRIYNLPDEGMFNEQMGEFIKELMEEVK